MKVVNSAAVEAVKVAEGVNRKILAYGDELMTCEFRFEQGAALPLHSHHHAQTSYLLAGAMEFEVDGQKVLLRTGENIFIPPHASHGVRCVEAAHIIEIFTPKRDDFLA